MGGSRGGVAMMSKEKDSESGKSDEEGYGTPAYSALEGSGFGFTRVLYGESAQEEGKARGGVQQKSESERLADLRSRIAGDSQLQAADIDFAFRDGALYIEGRVADEKTRYAVVNLALQFASQIVDHLKVG
jgi:hypothetical protein